MLYPKPCNQTSSVIPESFYRESRVGEANFFFTDSLPLQELHCFICANLLNPRTLRSISSSKPHFYFIFDITTFFPALLRFLVSLLDFFRHYYKIPLITEIFRPLL